MAKTRSIATLAVLAGTLALPALTLAQTPAPQTAPPPAPPASTATPPAPDTMAPATPPATDTKAEAASTMAPAAPATGAFATADGQYRADKLIGADVYDAQNQKLASVDDLLVGSNHEVSAAVLTVGGFFGVGGRLVKVPYTELHIGGDTITLPGTTKAQLDQMPTYNFSGAS